MDTYCSGANRGDADEIEWLRVFRDAVESAHDSVLITDAELDSPGPRILYANQAFREMTQYDPAEVIGLTPRILQGPQTDRSTLDWIRQRLEQGEPVEAQAINYRKDGSTFTIEWRITPVYYNARIRYYIAIQRDVSERERMLRLLREQAEVDELTGLYNRREANELLRLELERCQRYGTPVSVALLDIDRFKAVNDDHGHAIGDRILQGLAKLLVGRLRSNDRIARWGGEEFLLILPHTTAYCAVEAAEGVRQAIKQAVFASDITITASMGVAEYTPGESLDQLLERTDQALYRAKASGRNRVERAR
jgi:diguanylate cyclase (GGDEF)-like protein/PAS domain S-box-containing protein